MQAVGLHGFRPFPKQRKPPQNTSEAGPSGSYKTILPRTRNPPIEGSAKADNQNLVFKNDTPNHLQGGTFSVRLLTGDGYLRTA